MRNAFIDELVSLARKHEHIALVVGDLGYSVVEPFATEFPERFINAGIAEQNMAGLAAGMASEGYHVFTYSIANFPTFRCAEQLRNDVDYHNLPVTTVSVGGGVAYGALGYSHHAIQDYALMRMMPNTIIGAPADPLEARAVLKWIVEVHRGPSYLRLGKAGEPQINSKVRGIRPGVPVAVNGSANAKEVILSTGKGYAKANEVYRHLEKSRDTDELLLVTMPLWGYRSKDAFTNWAKGRARFSVFEDHLADGGFGSWVLESLAETDIQVNIRGFRPDIVGAVASESTLLAHL